MSWVYDHSFYYGYFIDGKLTDEDTVSDFCDTHSIGYLHLVNTKEVFIYLQQDLVSTDTNTYTSGFLKKEGDGFEDAVHPDIYNKGVTRTVPTVSQMVVDAINATFTVTETVQWIEYAFVE
jgi:hypothetical protein